MREVPRRPVLWSVVALATVLFGGGWVGTALADALAPGSPLASIVSFLHLPIALVLGLSAWIGLAIITVAPQAIVRLARGERRRINTRTVTIVPAGAWAFLPIGSGTGLATGVVTGVLSGGSPLALVVVSYWLVGTAYGGVLWALARTGYLPFPDTA